MYSREKNLHDRFIERYHSAISSKFSCKLVSSCSTIKNMEEYMYTLRKRVRFYETDGMRVVYHGNYLNWFEEARVEYMREGGVCLNDLLAEGIVFPIVEMNVKYMKSAVYDDIVLVRAYLREVNRVKLVFEYKVLRENTNELLATGQSVGTYTKISTGKIVRIPEERLKKLMDMAEEDRTDG